MSIQSAVDLIHSVSDMNVLFVGDAIIDEYRYVTPLNKSPKEYIIPVREESAEKFNGGVLAAANHLKTFCRSVKIATTAEDVVKIRYIEQNYFRKVFEVHHDLHVAPITIESLPKEDFDCVVATDFGHGAITNGMVEHLSDMTYLALNAQSNSSNWGFNLITKYPWAHYICIDEPEARLAAADRESPLEAVIEKLAHQRCHKMIVTCGNRGAVGYDGMSFHKMPAISKTPIDTMGAGDAFLAVTAPMAKHGSIKDLLLIGNAAGALKTQIVGHREAITKDALIDYIKETA